MAENEYKISLGVDLDDGSISDIQRQINGFESKLDPIQVKIEIENLAEIKKQIQNLGGTKGNAKIGIPIDAASLESSLKEVSATIKEIRASIGTLDSKSGMKSLLSSINQISAALENASKQFVELNANLNALGSKDFSLNFGINLGSGNQIARNAAYGSKVRGETLPQLKQQVSELVKYYNEIHKTSYNEMEALSRLVSGTKLATGDFFSSFLFGKDSVASRMGGGSLSAQMQAYKEFIDMFQKAASLRGMDLSSVTSGFSRAADDLIRDAQDIQTGAKEMDESFERLKQIFGGGINVEGLSETLKPIIENLEAIKKSIADLTKNASLEGLTQSFNRLSDAIEKLMNNANLVQDVLGSGLGTSATDAGTQRAIQAQSTLADTSAKTADAVSQSGQRIQQAFSQITSVGDLDPLQLKDDIDEADRFAAALSRLSNIQKNLGRIEIGKINTASGVEQLRTLEAQLESLSAEYNETVAEINNMGGVKATQMASFENQARTTSLRLEELRGKIADARAEMERGIRGNFGNYEAQIKSVEARFGRLTNQSGGLRTQIDLLKQAFAALKSADSTESLVSANETYKRVLKDVEAQLRINAAAERQANDTVALEQSKNNLALKMRNWLRDNSAAAKQFGGEISELQMRLQNCGNITGVRQVARDFENVAMRAKEAGLTSLSFVDRLKNQFAQYSSYVSVASVFMYATQALRSMFEQVKAIDTAMTELKKVTDETDESYNRFLSNAASRSKELGTTIDGLVTSTADFARLGYGFEESQGLAEVANIYAVVGDEIGSVEDATKSLISTLAAFKDEASGINDDDFAMDIIDKFNEVSNNFAISSGGIGEAMQRSASSLRAANNTIDESIALITAANTVVVLCHAA